MKYQDVKVSLVEEKGLLTDKELRKMTLGVALFVLGLCLTVGILALKIFGVGLTVIVIFMSLLGFGWIFDMVVENNDSLPKVRMISKLWWVSYIMFGVSWLVLSYFNF